MKTRVAISGMPKSGRTLIAYALSQLTNITFLQGRTMYEWRELYHVDQKEDPTWKDLFLISSSALIERIEMEGKAGSFISDGAVFSELMYLRLTKEIRKGSASSEQDKIMASLENICFGYAAGHYDMVIHMETPAPHRTDRETEIFEGMFDRRKVPYKIFGSDSPVETLDRIVSLLNLPVKMTTENAFFLTTNNVYINAL